MRKLIALQMYIACAQGVVSPVAYLPRAAISQGYRVIAEISRGWRSFTDAEALPSGAPSSQLTLPFYHKGYWVLTQRLSIPSDSTILYIEGVSGKVSVYQDKRLLWRGDTHLIWIPLVGKGMAELRLIGHDGGILGGIYLLARADTQAWQRAAYPDSMAVCYAPAVSLSFYQSLSVEPLLTSQGKCIGYRIRPPARILSVLSQRRHALALMTDDPSSKPTVWQAISLWDNASYKVAFVLMWTALVIFSLSFPELRRTFWTGLYAPRTVGLFENALTLVWLLAVSLVCIKGRMLIAFWTFLFLEALLLEYMLGIGQWAWQSWLLLMGGILIIGLLSPAYVWFGLVGAWGLRALRFVLYFPKLAYLCSAEAFMGILFLSA